MFSHLLSGMVEKCTVSEALSETDSSAPLSLGDFVLKENMT